MVHDLFLKKWERRQSQGIEFNWIHCFLFWGAIGISLLAVPVQAQEIKDYFEQAQVAYNEGNYKKAVELLEQIIALNPDIAPAYNALGLAYKQLNANLAEVAWYFKTAIEIDPKFVDAYSNLAKAYYGLGFFDRAQKACLDGLKIDPQHLDAQLTLGWIYLIGQNRFNDAIPYFQFVADKTKNSNALYGLGLAYFMTSNKTGLFETITTLREIGQNDLAAQLEKMTRDKDDQERRQRGELPSDVAPPGMPGRPAQTVPNQRPERPGSTEVPEGGFRVRLKGKLYNIGNEEKNLRPRY